MWKTYFVIIILGWRMGLSTDDRDRTPAEDLFHERLDIRQIGLVLECRAAMMTDYPVQLFPSFGKHFGKGTTCQNERDQRGAGRVASRPKKVARQRSDLFLGQVVFRLFVKEFSRVALLLLGILGCFFSQGVKEVVPSCTTAQTMLPRSDLIWEFGEN